MTTRSKLHSEEKQNPRASTKRCHQLAQYSTEMNSEYAKAPISPVASKDNVYL